MEKSRLFNAIDTFPCVRKKADWVKRHIQSSECFAERLVAFVCVEGIHFSGAFCAIYWFRTKNLLSGLCFSNELISRDEALHTEFGIALYHKLWNKLTEDKIHAIIKEAVDIETEFICEALPCRLIGMNSDLMTQYIQFVADRLSVQLGYDKIYNVTNPFEFMELISLEGKTNFFERKVGEYSLTNKNNNNAFEFSEDF
jgi:ribonucleoside-diphosphate reductase subunit M2